MDDVILCQSKRENSGCVGGRLSVKADWGKNTTDYRNHHFQVRSIHASHQSLGKGSQGNPDKA